MAYGMFFALAVPATAQQAPAGTEDDNAAEKREAPPVPEVLIHELQTAAATFHKVPDPVACGKFHGLVSACLPVQDVSVTAAVFDEIQKCRCYHCRRALKGFIYRTEEMPEEARRPYADLLGKSRTTLMRLEYYGDHIYGGWGNIIYCERPPVSRVTYLLAHYWQNRGGASANTHWLVRKMSAINHEMARVGLVIIRDDIERQVKDGAGGGLSSDLLPLIDTALRLNEYVTRDKVALFAIAEALKTSDRRLVELAASELIDQNRHQYREKMQEFLNVAILQHKYLLEAAMEKKDEKKQFDEEAIMSALDAALREITPKASSR
jgi:hypothetical protein